jgi:hypothetical protein
MEYEIKVGSHLPNVSRIDIGGAVLRGDKSAEWILKTYYGLRATSNPAPPETITDSTDFEGGKVISEVISGHDAGR